MKLSLSILYTHQNIGRLTRHVLYRQSRRLSRRSILWIFTVKEKAGGLLSVWMYKQTASVENKKAKRDMTVLSKKAKRKKDSGGQRRLTVSIRQGVISDSHAHLSWAVTGLMPFLLIRTVGQIGGYMRVEVNQTNPQLWGKLGVEEARTAAERLSGDGFKAWVLLALNQDGFVWQGDLEPRTVYELLDRGYLTPFGDGNYLFKPDGEPGDVDVPAEWSKIADLYGSSNQQDLSYVRDKLKSACLDDRMEDVLVYWTEKYGALQEVDHSRARNRLRFDFSVVLVWWLWDHFRFQPGDVLEVEEGAKLLRFHDISFMDMIQNGVRKRRITKIVMDEAAVKIWNNALETRKFEVPLECVGKILKNRDSL